MLGQILNQVALLILVLFFVLKMWKIDLAEIFKDNKGKLSFIRFESTVALGLMVWVVKRSIGVEVSEVKLELIVILGILAFFPKLFQKMVEKYAGKKNEN